ncbi:MAG: hypothetical protein EZS28_011304 [Streblomastix strix]|uniref:Uncharacterized protein n=1 Tax=Streblomastix strix TaxID=222440 RepID=A0A5J4WDX8_9EUKA|nr:MAG: hypothetical protein EZS28_011304 [Streblomastix strix]
MLDIHVRRWLLEEQQLVQWCEVQGADANNLNARVNFNAKANATASNDKNMEQANQFYYGKAADGPEISEHLKFWLSFSTACGPFNQFAILRDAQNLWNTAIYARNVSPLESIIAGKRHCGVLIYIPLCEIDRAAGGDVVSAPSDLYHSLTFENINTNDLDDFYGHVDAGGDLKANANIFYYTTLYNGSNATKTLYPNKYMLAWKMATDESFMLRYNSSKIGARTNIQVIFNGNLTKGIIDTTQLNPSQNQNDFKQFIAMRSYPDPHQVAQTLIMHFLRDAFIRITFDDNQDPQVLSMDVIGEIGGSSIRSG